MIVANADRTLRGRMRHGRVKETYTDRQAFDHGPHRTVELRPQSARDGVADAPGSATELIPEPAKVEQVNLTITIGVDPWQKFFVTSRLPNASRTAAKSNRSRVPLPSMSRYRKYRSSPTVPSNEIQPDLR